MPEEHGDFFVGGAVGVLPEAWGLEEGVGLFPEGDFLAEGGVGGEVEVRGEIGAIMGEEAIGDDAVARGEDAGGEGGLDGGGDGGEGGGVGRAVWEGGEEGEFLEVGCGEEGGVEAGDEEEEGARHEGLLGERVGE